ncbi:hypothetical protein BGW80DRAFT_1282456 [Lactifluus volemus]|nr:hypothetical protein BGW80DRAFT_1282456 [Lactifluus volemus]
MPVPIPSSSLSKKEVLEMLLARLDNISDESVPPELIPKLEELRKELWLATCMPFSKVDESVVVRVGITSPPVFLTLSEEKRGEFEAAGKAIVTDFTVQHIPVARSIFPQATYRAREPIIGAILLNLCLAMSPMPFNDTQRLLLNYDFPIEETTFKTDSGTHSFSGTAEYLLINVQPGQFSVDFWMAYPTMSLGYATPNNMPATPIIIGTKQDGLLDAVPRATITVASFCKRYGLSTLRGCITSGEQWMFFVYRGPDGSRVPPLKGQLYLESEIICLGDDLKNLPLVLGS